MAAAAAAAPRIGRANVVVFFPASSLSSSRLALASAARTSSQAGESERSVRVSMLTCRRRLFRLLPSLGTMPSSSS